VAHLLDARDRRGEEACYGASLAGDVRVKLRPARGADRPDPRLRRGAIRDDKLRLRERRFSEGRCGRRPNPR
jgi:hypothetical protein